MHHPVIETIVKLRENNKKDVNHFRIEVEALGANVE